ncbi:hypothetical protein PVAP13_3KG203605 [Panicum virgatum]|uniref:Uncharacterized protein n=1 Tax=Panicum virgatum TaxID=38727 RepID=A0A8T0UMF1_PANVG|nr:hypothetical protein PVAP13_3KG203605 [Panicum virgatum]
MFFQRILPIIPPNRSLRPHRSFGGSSRTRSYHLNVPSLPSAPLCCPPLSSRRDSSMVTCAWINSLGTWSKTPASSNYVATSRTSGQQT